MSGPTLGAALGSAWELPHNGKTYRASLIDQALKDKWEKRQFQKDVELAAMMRTLRTDDEHKAEVERIRQKYLDGGYALLGPDGLESFQRLAKTRNMGPIMELLGFIFSCDENELIGLVAARQEEVLNLLTVIIKESFPGVAVNLAAGEGVSPTPGVPEKNSPAAA